MPTLQLLVFWLGLEVVVVLVGVDILHIQLQCDIVGLVAIVAPAFHIECLALQSVKVGEVQVVSANGNLAIVATTIGTHKRWVIGNIPNGFIDSTCRNCLYNFPSVFLGKSLGLLKAVNVLFQAHASVNRLNSPEVIDLVGAAEDDTTLNLTLFVIFPVGFPIHIWFVSAVSLRSIEGVVYASARSA